MRADDGRWLLEICDPLDGWMVVDPEGSEPARAEGSFAMSFELAR